MRVLYSWDPLSWSQINIILSYLKPRNGDAFTLMKLCRSRFKYALRKCKRDKETIVSDRIAEKMCQTDQRNF